MGERVIRVKGKGSISAKPDMIRLTLTLEGVEKEYNKALEYSAKNTVRLKDLLSDFGFGNDDIKTHEFIIHPKYEWANGIVNKGKRKLEGYEYSHVVNLEFPFDNQLLGKILFRLSKAKDISPEISFKFFVKDTEAQKNELIKKAVADAKAKAEIIALASGVSLGDIISIDYSWEQISLEVTPLINFDESCLCFDDEEDTGEAFDNLDIVPDNISATDTVAVIWAIS